MYEEHSSLTAVVTLTRIYGYDWQEVLSTSCNRIIATHSFCPIASHPRLFDFFNINNGRKGISGKCTVVFRTTGFWHWYIFIYYLGFQKAKYDAAMKGSLEALLTLSHIDPVDLHYGSQIGRVFDVLYHCMSRANHPRSPNPTREHFEAATCFCLVLKNLGPSPSDIDDMPACLSKGFARIWPVIWRVIDSTFVLFLTAQYTQISAKTRLIIKGHVVALFRILGYDKNVVRKMIITPGVNSFVLKIWAMEVEIPDYHPDDGEYCFTITGFLDLVFGALADDKDGLGQFLVPMNGDMKYLASIALKHVQHSFRRAQSDMDSIIWSIHIITVLSYICDPIRNAFLAHHSIPAVTKIVVAMTADTPPLDKASASLKAGAISYGFWNLILLIQSSEGVTWVIQALEAKLLFALAQCEVWVPYMTDDPNQFLYPLLDKVLPNYTAYRSVLYVMEKSLTKIQQLGLDARKSENVPLWRAWNKFAELAESRMEVLQTASGGLLQAHERCHNATVSPYIFLGKLVLIGRIQCARAKVRGEFQQCGGCLSAQYCSKPCQTHDWKFGGHRQFCKQLVALRYGEFLKGSYNTTAEIGYIRWKHT